MKRTRGLFFILPFIFVSCFNHNDASSIVQSPPLKKQKQRVAVLKKKLHNAKEELGKIEKNMDQMMQEIYAAELAIIRSEIDLYEKKGEKPLYLFIEERELLYRMIQSPSSHLAIDAQVELDRILRIITELSDKEKHVF